MADTQRTRASILVLLADNVTGQISPQDLRDYVVTVMEPEFTNPGDFWAKPSPKFTTTDKTARGWILYSQYMGSAVSWMNILYMDKSTGYWMLANVSASAQTGMLGLAMNSYAADFSTAQVLLEGCVYDSSFSTIFSRLVGRPVYLASGGTGSITTTITTNSVLVVGMVMPSEWGWSTSGKWYFKPDWKIAGQ